MTEVMQGKYYVNLLQQELLPVKPLWSLKRVFIVWGVVAFIMIAWALLSHNQFIQADKRHVQLTSDKKYLNSQLTQLENELKEHKPDNKLKEKINLLASVLNNKTQLNLDLTDTTKTQVAGFAESMTELSENHHKDISLAVVQISNDDMTFAGITKKAQAVPAWLAGFEDSTFLSGKQFINFLLEENEEKQIEFTVSSKVELEEAENDE